MEKLELKHLSGYLPYGLKLWHNQWKEILIMDCAGSNCDTLSIEDVSEYAKPILRPLSELTKKIEVNGERFVPIISLSRYVDNGHNHVDSAYHKSSNYITVLTQKCDDVENVKFRFTYEGISAIERSGEAVSFVTYDKIKAKLYEWHYDIHGLIEKDLAIDINTLNK